MLIDCVLIRTATKTVFRWEGRILDLSNTPISVQEFLRECQVGQLGITKSRPGGVERDCTLDTQYLRRSWLQNSAIQHFFWPQRSTSSFITPRASYRRRTRQPLTVDPYQSSTQHIVSADDVNRHGLKVCLRCNVEFDRRKSRTVGFKQTLCDDCFQEGPRKRTGKMMFDHKTAPVLEFDHEGSKLSPDEIAASRRRN